MLTFTLPRPTTPTTQYIHSSLHSEENVKILSKNERFHTLTKIQKIFWDTFFSLILCSYYCKWSNKYKSYLLDESRSLCDVNQISDCMLYFTLLRAQQILSKKKFRLPGTILGQILGVGAVLWWGITMCGYITI